MERNTQYTGYTYKLIQWRQEFTHQQKFKASEVKLFNVAYFMTFGLHSNNHR